MVEEVENRELQLSAEELRQMTDWPDPLIEEFLALIQGIVQITQNTNITIENISLVETGLNALRARVNNLTQALETLENQQALSKVPSDIRRNRQHIADLFGLAAETAIGLQKERAARKRAESLIASYILSEAMLA